MSQAQRPTSTIWVLFLAGPVIWTSHFFVVYLLAEAVCATGGFDARIGGLRVLSFVTVAATAIAAAAIAGFTWRSYRRWLNPTTETAPSAAAHGTTAADRRDSERGLALSGALLGVVFIVAVLFVGVPAFFLQSC